LISRLRFQIPVFTAIRTILNTMHRMVYLFLPHFSRGLGVDVSALSLGLTARAFVGIFGPLVASVSDSRGRKVGLLLGLCLFTAGVALVVFWPTYLAFVLALVLTTLGKYTFDPTMHAYLGDRVPYQRRGLAIALTEVGWSLSFIVGVPLVGFIIARGGWMSPFSIFALLGAVSFGLVVWMIPMGSPAKEASLVVAPTKGANVPVWHNFRAVLAYPASLAGLMVGFTCSAANEIINLLLGIWMEDAFGLKIMALGATAVVIGLAELGGESLVGGLADRLGKPQSVGIGLGLNILAAAMFPFLGRSLVGALVGLVLFYITFEFTLVSSIPMMTEVMPSSRATLMAFYVASLSLGRALGALLAIPFYNWGLVISAAAVVAFDILALLALRSLWKLRS
jgi:predicted MFS family arabinose efflux permease